MHHKDINAEVKKYMKLEYETGNRKHVEKRKKVCPISEGRLKAMCKGLFY